MEDALRSSRGNGGRATRNTNCSCTLHSMQSEHTSRLRASLESSSAASRSPSALAACSRLVSACTPRQQQEIRPFRQSGETKVILAIAGSDSGGGAGVQADLKTFAACGAYGTSAITAVTAQNTHGVFRITALSPADVRGQIDAVLNDFPVSVVKTGLLPTVETVEVVARALRGRPDIQLIVDPVLVATSGHALATNQVGAAVADKLFPLSALITPNLSEAASILGCGQICDVAGMRSAASSLLAKGPRNVLIKGGHLIGSSDVPDILHDGTATHVMLGRRIQTTNDHGTGCTMASAIAAFLAKGMSMISAVRGAKEYVSQALQESRHLQIGSGAHRPFNHCFALHPWREHSLDNLDLRLYAITDATCNLRFERSNQQSVEAAIAGGATTIQLREKDLSTRAFCNEAADVLAITRPRGVKLLINDRIDVALAAGADGVHIGQDDLPVQHARRLLGPNMLLGVSVKTVDQAKQAEADGASYLGAGAVYRTSTKMSSTIRMDTLAAICTAVRIPVVAIGGINAANAGDCIAVGCQGVAAVSALFGVEDTAQAAQRLLEAVVTSSI